MASDFYYPTTKNAIQKTLAAQLLSTATTGDAITFDDVDGIDNTPGVLVINRVNSNGTSTPSSREFISYTGTSGNTVLIETRNVDDSGAARTHAVGSIVEFVADAVWAKRVIDQFKIEHNADGTHNTTQMQGWVPITETFTYASATTITVASGATNRFQIGDKLKLTNSTVKYFYVVGVASTLLTITGGSDYALADAAITSPYLSRVDRPFGFPRYFRHTMVLDGWSGTPTQSSKFSISTGGTVTFSVYITGTSDETTGAGTTFTLPVVPVNNMYYSVRVTDNGTAAATPGMVAIAASTGLGTCYSTMAAGGWTGSGTKAIGATTFSYFI